MGYLNHSNVSFYGDDYLISRTLNTIDLDIYLFICLFMYSFIHVISFITLTSILFICKYFIYLFILFQICLFHVIYNCQEKATVDISIVNILMLVIKVIPIY